MNIGVLGGTFDPIHMGHLIIAEETRTRLDLAEVLFMPAREPWLKANNYISPAEHRVQMVAELKGQIGVGDKLFFILGWDNLIQLPQWHEPSQLVKMCHLVAVPRVGYLSSCLIRRR